MSNIAAETTQKVRACLVEQGWAEVKSQHFQHPSVDVAVEVGYVLGECTVKFLKIDHRGAEGSMHERDGLPKDIERGVGDEFVAKIRARVDAIVVEAAW